MPIRTTSAMILAVLLQSACTSMPDRGPLGPATQSAFAATPSADELPLFRELAREAWQRQEFRRAHALMAAITLHEDAVGLDWMTRAELAMDSVLLSDAALAYSTVASRWPEQARQADWGRVIQQSAFRIRRDEVHRADYLALVEALYAADFLLVYGLQPDALWSDLAADALESGDVVRAREVLARIDSVEALLGMRVDQRFDRLVALEPERFDIASAARRATMRSEKIVALHPRELNAFVQYAYALFDEGRHADVLAMCEAILADVERSAGQSPPFDDVDEALNWVYNHKAAALRALGRWDEALTVMEAARLLPEQRSENVSQSINLAAHYIDAGRFADALAAVEPLECDDNVSPYGCMQLHSVLHAAHLRLGNTAQAAKAFNYLSANRKDAEDTWISATLESGDLDAAARRLIAQLEDPSERGSALLGAQTYLPFPVTTVMQERQARRQQLLARDDVATALGRVGRQISVPIYRTPN